MSHALSGLVLVFVLFLFPIISHHTHDLLHTTSGAVLFGPRLVVTAAHCLGAAQNFVVGAHTSTNQGRRVAYRDFAVHPQYNSAQYSHDIVVFYLEEEIKNIPYIKLKQEPITTPGEIYTVIGFGDINGQDFTRLQLSDHLREVDVEYIPNDICDLMHGNNGEVTEDMLCAGGNSKDACYGDSGGPLLQTDPNDDIANDFLVGVVSWGRGCADPRYPGVYTRISYFFDWLVEMSCVRDFASAPDYMDCETLLGLNLETPSPSSSPSSSPTTESQCIDRGQFCEKGKGCCPGYRCRGQICAPSGAGEKEKLSGGFGGAGGAASHRSHRLGGGGGGGNQYNPDFMYFP